MIRVLWMDDNRCWHKKTFLFYAAAVSAMKDLQSNAITTAFISAPILGIRFMRDLWRATR